MAIKNSPGLLRKALILAIFSAIFIALASSIAVKKSNTWDESAHILAGYSYLKEGMDYLSPLNHPVFGRLLTGLLPAALLELDFNPAVRPEEALDSDFFPYSLKFLFENRAPGMEILFLSRLMNILTGALLGCYLFVWSERLWGVAGGALSLFFYLLCPNILAHSSLATTDMPVTAFSFISAYYLYRMSSDGVTPGRVFSASLFAALALTSKHTALLLAPLAALSFSLTLKKEPLIKTVAGYLAFVLGVYIIVWAVYGLRFHSPSPNYMTLNWARFSSFSLEPAFSLLRGLKLLPEAYLYSLEGTLAGAGSGRAAFLMGKYSIDGWWYYFIVAFLIKTPIPVIIFLTATFLYLSREKEALLKALAFAIFPALLIFASVSLQKVNIGLRHALPAYPFIFLLIGFIPNIKAGAGRMGGTGGMGGMGKAAKAVFVISILWYIVSAARIHPHELAYFNEFTGGPQKGYRYLVDSNLDWGQDLMGLREYMDKNGIGSVKLAYFGFSDPRYYGIEYEYLPSYIIPEPRNVRDAVPLEGWFAVSATMLQGVYLGDRDFYRVFRESKPVDTIGYSIFIYRF